MYLIQNFIVYICIFLNISLFRVQKKQAKKFSSLKSFLSASVRSPERSPGLLRYIVQTTSSAQYIYIVLQSVVRICSFCLRVSNLLLPLRRPANHTRISLEFINQLPILDLPLLYPSYFHLSTSFLCNTTIKVWLFFHIIVDFFTFS